VFAVNIAVDAITADGATEDAVCGVEKPKANRMDSVDARLEPNMAAPLTMFSRNRKQTGPKRGMQKFGCGISGATGVTNQQAPTLAHRTRKDGAAQVRGTHPSKIAKGGAAAIW
jgi:hypothetical protein